MSSLNPQTESLISQWTKQMSDRDSIHPDRLRELESHLVDSVMALKKQGLADEEAFLVAKHRLGSDADLLHEFGKSDRGYVWTNRVVWMCLGYLAIMVSIGLINTTETIASAVAIGLIGSNHLGIVTAITTVIGFAGIAGVIWALLQISRLKSKHSFSITPLRMITFTILLVLILPLFGVGSEMAINVTLSRMLAPAEFGKLSLARQFASWIIQVVHPVGIALLAMVLLHRRQTNLKLS